MLGSDKRERSKLAASTMGFDGSDQEHNPREGGDDLSASVANDGEEKGRLATPAKDDVAAAMGDVAADDAEEKSPRTPRRDLTQSMAVGTDDLEKSGSSSDSTHGSPTATPPLSPRDPQTPGSAPVGSSNNNTPHPDTGAFLNREMPKAQAKAAPANSPWWASYPLTAIMLLAGFGAGLNFMRSFMNGRYTLADTFVPTIMSDTNFKVFGDVTNLMVLGTSILAKAGLDYAYNHNPLSSIGSSIINTGKGATLGALSAFGYKQATNENLPGAEAVVSHVANLAQQSFAAVGKGRS